MKPSKHGKFPFNFTNLIWVSLVLVNLGAFNFADSSQELGWGTDSRKPGKCPKADPNMHCDASECLTDAQCPEDLKCCYQEQCGRICVKPAAKTCNEEIISTKPGSCAPPENIQCFQCFDQCTSDNDCEGPTKCCPQPGCGNQCNVLKKE